MNEFNENVNRWTIPVIMVTVVNSEKFQKWMTVSEICWVLCILDVPWPLLRIGSPPLGLGPDPKPSVPTFVLWTPVGELESTWRSGSTEVPPTSSLSLFSAYSYHYREETINSQSQSKKHFWLHRARQRFCRFYSRTKCIRKYKIETSELNQPTSTNTHSSDHLVLDSLRVLVLPSVWQEVDLDIRVPRSAVVSDRKFFGSENSYDQLMTNFIVPQLQL